MSTFVPSKPSERAKSDSTQDHDLHNKASLIDLLYTTKRGAAATDSHGRCNDKHKGKPLPQQLATRDAATSGETLAKEDAATSYEKHIQETGPVCSFRTCQLVPQRTKLYLHWFKKESDTTAS